MAVPKKRHTKSRRNNRRSHISLAAPSLAPCRRCGRPSLPHRACPRCGRYGEVEAVDIMKKLDKKTKKEKEKRAAGEPAAAAGSGKRKEMSWEEMSKR